MSLTRTLPLALATLAVMIAWSASPTAAPEIPADAASVRHALSRLTFGPRPGDVERIQQVGLERWLNDQLAPGSGDNAALKTRLAALETLNLDSSRIARDYIIPAREARRARQQAAQPGAPSTANPQADLPPEMRRPPAGPATGQRQVIEELATAKLLRAAYSDRQLEEVLVDFWFNHFNVFAGKGREPIFITSYDRDTIRPRVLGRFRDLLGATAQSPAMLFYLDNWLSTSPDASQALARMRTRRPPGAQAAPNAVRSAGLNENYGRELLELHTLGVDGGYTQLDVVEVARAFTGWTIDPRTQGFRFAPALHDNGSKVVLGQRIAPNGGISDGERVLDILASHPSTARHIATKLARRFISDTPPPALVERAARRFRDTDGDIREVVRTIVTSPEFFAADTVRAKVKTPFEFVVSAVRALDGDIRNARPLLRALQELGMPSYLCQPPTGYADTADTWLSSGALVSRMNLALELGSPNSRALTVASLKDDAARRQVALTLGSPEFQRR
ncbi:MAG: DUF1800 domain-containing protein [Vicinamibacterales bacterium]